MIFRGGRPLVCVGRPERGFHIGYRRRGGGAYISFERGFSKIDERAGMPPRARTRCIQVPHLVFMVARMAERDGRAVDRGGKKIWKNQALQGQGRVASRRIRVARIQCVTQLHSLTQMDHSQSFFVLSVI